MGRMAERENDSEVTPATVGIPMDRYEELLAAERRLMAMEAVGVDNWEGMPEVMNILNDEGA